FDPPSIEELQTRPSKVPYPQSKIRFQHYGKIAEQLIQKAIQMPDGEQKTEFVRHIANHMKISYFSWNKDAVNDQIILEALKEISDGQLELPSDTVLTEVKEPVYRPSQQQKKRRSKGGHKR
ncbi:MAG: DUF4290 domain-containing protein, partial [Bacteroidales bacterium]|nr:DUF4290 domain-containing protein [Bacteroidales bacterium]